MTDGLEMKAMSETSSGSLPRVKLSFSPVRTAALAASSSHRKERHARSPRWVTRCHPGSTLSPIGRGSASDGGEVVFTGVVDGKRGVFRTNEGTIIDVVSEDSPPPEGLRFDGIGDRNGNAPALNDAGDVALAAR